MTSLSAYDDFPQLYLVFVLQRCSLQFIVMVFFKRNGEPRTNPIITALDNGERELAFDNASLYAAQQFGLEINLGAHKVGSWLI